MKFSLQFLLRISSYGLDKLISHSPERLFEDGKIERSLILKIE